MVRAPPTGVTCFWASARKASISPAAAAAMPRSSASIAASCESASTSISAIFAMTAWGVGDWGIAAPPASERSSGSSCASPSSSSMANPCDVIGGWVGERRAFAEEKRTGMRPKMGYPTGAPSGGMGCGVSRRC